MDHLLIGQSELQLNAMKDNPNFEIYKISTEPISMRIISEIYIVYAYEKYVPVVDVLILKRKLRATIYASSTVFAKFFEDARLMNNGSIIDLEFWIQKEGSSRFSKYIMSEK